MDPDRVRSELHALEPIFHHSPPGSDRAEFESFIADDYWEVGASGAVYSREFVLDTVVERHRLPASVDSSLEIQEFVVRHLDGETWLATYELHQGERVTRRSTIWQLSDRWRAIYHQGTIS